MGDTSAKPETAPVERRHLHRNRVLKGALVVFGNHDRVIDCAIRNLSDEGAKVTLGSTIGIPDTFELMIPAEHRIAPARAIWRTERELGIALTGPFQPTARRG
ncbi:MAG: PilZ domain-containing protein [Bauldia sp.]|nr:PilZ domain-containing protein [Bauldia sp.]